MFNILEYIHDIVQETTTRRERRKWRGCTWAVQYKRDKEEREMEETKRRYKNDKQLRAQYMKGKLFSSVKININTLLIQTARKSCNQRAGAKEFESWTNPIAYGNETIIRAAPKGLGNYKFNTTIIPSHCRDSDIFINLQTRNIKYDKLLQKNSKIHTSKHLMSISGPVTPSVIRPTSRKPLYHYLNT